MLVSRWAGQSRPEPRAPPCTSWWARPRAPQDAVRNTPSICPDDQSFRKEGTCDPGIGFPNRYPWPKSQPSFESSVACRADSTPSAVTSFPRLRPRPMTARTIAASPSSVSKSRTKLLSILMWSTGKRFRCVSEAKPVPKSSRAMLSPASLKRRSVFDTEFLPDPRRTDSVISTSNARGRPAPPRSPRRIRSRVPAR